MNDERREVSLAASDFKSPSRDWRPSAAMPVGKASPTTGTGAGPGGREAGMALNADSGGAQIKATPIHFGSESPLPTTFCPFVVICGQVPFLDSSHDKSLLDIAVAVSSRRRTTDYPATSHVNPLWKNFVLTLRCDVMPVKRGSNYFADVV